MIWIRISAAKHVNMFATSPTQEVT